MRLTTLELEMLCSVLGHALAGSVDDEPWSAMLESARDTAWYAAESAHAKLLRLRAKRLDE